MIIARAPLRLSFAGGGTDLRAYYEPFGGLVVSTAINRYVYVMLRPGKVGSPVHMIASDAGTYLQGPLAGITGAATLPRAVLDHFGVTSGVEIFIASQVPSGTGLGSSSALAVALIHAVSTYAGHPLTPAAAADLACTIEIEHLHAPIGKQDQYASALGGVNELAFTGEGVCARPLRLSPDVRQALAGRLLLFFTGLRHDGPSILGRQRQASEERDPQTITALHALKALARQVIAVLESGDLDSLGDLLHAGWVQKQRVTGGISTAFIDHCYSVARRAGARGGKIAGAGGGGFLLLECVPERQAAVTAALTPLGLHPFAFALEEGPAGVVCDALTRVEPPC